MTTIVAVAGGKGGTGKTFIATNIAYILSAKKAKTLLVDADVDNPSIESVLQININRVVYAKKFKPVVNQGKCRGCGLCTEKCPHHALTLLPSKKLVFIETLCIGCSICRLVCPHNAISNGESIEGLFKYGTTREGIAVIIGELVPGNKRSIVMVTRLIEEHLEVFKKYNYVIIDSPPGTSSILHPIIKYSTHVLVITEPTPLGVHDFKKFLKLVNKYCNKKLLVIINKYGVPSRSYGEIEEFLRKQKLPYIRIPYSNIVFKSYVSREILATMYRGTEVYRQLEKIAEFIQQEA